MSATVKVVVLLWVLTDIVNGAIGIRRLNKENVYSRVYIAFTREELVPRFSPYNDGHIFEDKAGLSFRHRFSVFSALAQNVAIGFDAQRESQAVLIFVPYQKRKLEKKKRKGIGSRSATVDQGTS